MRQLLLILLLACSAIAQTREPFPSDYKTSPCASRVPCVSFEKSAMRSAAQQIMGQRIDSGWIYNRWNENMSLFAPYCAKRATCLTTPGNDAIFCSDIFGREVEDSCDAHYSEKKAKKDWENCHAFARVWAFGVAANSTGDRENVLDCIKQSASPSPRKMEVWFDPPDVPIEFMDAVTVYAIDSQTRVPVEASISLEGDTLFTSESPTGKGLTYYAFTLKSKVRRVPAANGHQRLVPRDLILTAPDYETVRAPMPTKVHPLDVRMTPARLKSGKNTVKIAAKDSQTGERVEMRVFVGDQQIGNTNEMLEIALPKRKQPEIWLKSLFNAYDDVIVVPAGK